MPSFPDSVFAPANRSAGQTIDARDRADTPRVAVITETMARTYFGSVNAVGRRFRSANDPNAWTEVIGVVRDTGTGDFNDDVLDPIAPPFYSSHTQSGAASMAAVAGRAGSRSRRQAARSGTRSSMLAPNVASSLMPLELRKLYLIGRGLSALASLATVIVAFALGIAVAVRCDDCIAFHVKAALKPGAQTILKDNISWHFPFPGANTTPWQLEGTVRALRGRGYADLVCVQNKTVVTDAFVDLGREVTAALGAPEFSRLSRSPGCPATVASMLRSRHHPTRRAPPAGCPVASRPRGR